MDGSVRESVLMKKLEDIERALGELKSLQPLLTELQANNEYQRLQLNEAKKLRAVMERIEDALKGRGDYSGIHGGIHRADGDAPDGNSNK